MLSWNNQTLLFPIPLGLADQYHRSVFPLIRFQGPKSSLHEVDLALVATMNEIYRMKEIVKNTSDFKELIHESKVQYDTLLEDKQDLAKAMADKKTFNPFKLLSTYRAARLLSETGKALWIETLTTSERLRRQTLSVDTLATQAVGDDDLPPGARISAIAVQLDDTDTYPDDIGASLFSDADALIASQRELDPHINPFSDHYQVKDSRTSAVPEDGSKFSTDDGATSSTSPSSRLPEVQNFQNSYVASRPAIHTPTLN
ncbi:uncharacterized protein F5147DRAFT_709230 [Suillus discolor]|uniref:Uncharacterized protein n=1 Tax=Suillus discolor TaxID=1912936 RepID=A0A9P7JRA3_9AGAM|nr:uncharacterized protein F5147DRAFT_709230 [Suillus discolor]KAG2101349.1 hypothetical protein F5147DRAFT_709230 [Suillus discolor]